MSSINVQHRMAAAALGAITAAGLASIPFWAQSSPANAATGDHDAAYGIEASGAAPIDAKPSVTGTGSTTRTASGSARSSDGSISIGSASVSAGRGKATAKISGFSAFDGLVHASSVTANCTDGRVSSSASGTSGSLGKKGSVAYDVHLHHGDGSTTVIGMQVHVTGGHGVPAETISIASATCAPTASTPTGGPSSPPSRRPTTAPTRRPTSPPGHPPAKPTSAPTRTAPRTTAGHPRPAATNSPAPAPTPVTTHLPVTG